MVSKAKPLTRETLDASRRDRSDLLKGVPESIPNLVAELGKTATTEQDQLVLTSLGIELDAAGLDWVDLANLIRFQVVAHRVATMRGVINAAKAHPKAHRLDQWQTKFLKSVGQRNALLTDKQMACLQSITDSLDMSDDDWALYVLSRSGAERMN